MQYVIVGAGPAGVTAAETLRKTDPAGDVVLLGGEPEPPYSRMAIPYYLAGDIEEKGTHIRQTGGHYDDLGIRYVQGTVEGVSAADNRLTLKGGDTLAYDRLLVATGSSATYPPAPGFDRPAVHHCWTLEDARGIIGLAKPGAKVVMLGVGFVACIIMQALVKRGVELTVVAGPSGRMVRSMFDLTAGGMIRNWLESKGVRVVVGTRVAEIKDGPSVALDSGEWRLPFVGSRRRHDFLDRGAAYPEEGEMRWASWQEDRLVGLEAADEGFAVLVQRKCAGQQMRINYRTAKDGWIKVELVNQPSTPPKKVLPFDGFGLEGAETLTGDELSRVVQWNGSGDLSGLKEQEVSLRLHLYKAKIFSIAL